ncbi:MAG: phospholipase D-like domain-containing protein [Candidatus Kapaibacteriota bacterium]
MRILTTPWKADFLDLVHQSKKSIKITSPFVKNDICSEMISAKVSSSKIELITSFKLMNIHSGSLDISALESIIDNNGVVRSVPKLHSKVYIFDDVKAIITSGNLTHGGMLKNFEYGIYLDEPLIIKDIVQDFKLLTESEKIGEIKKSHLDKVRTILASVPKSTSPKLPSFEIETPEENLDVIETPVEPIIRSLKLTGQTLEIFKCVHSIQNQIFTLAEVYQFENQIKEKYPSNNNIKPKIRQQLQSLRNLGLLEFLGSGNYKKLWK